MRNVYFFQVSQISQNEIILYQLKEHKIFFSYFQVNEHYYLFFYDEKPIKIDFFDKINSFIKELDSKKRKIRSLRRFLLYALEIMKRITMPRFTYWELWVHS